MHDINLLLSARGIIFLFLTSLTAFISISIFNLQFPFFLYLLYNFEYLCLLILFVGGGVRMFCASVIDHCTRPSLPDRIKALVPQVSHLHRSTHTHTHTHTLSLSLSLFLSHTLSLSQSLRRFTSSYRWSACRAAHYSHPPGEISMLVRSNAFVQTDRNSTAHMHTCVLSYHVCILF